MFKISDDNIFDEVVRNIAARVIKTAVSDAKNKMVNEKDKKDAKKWLRSDDCKMYCEILDIDYFRMIKKLKIIGGH